VMDTKLAQYSAAGCLPIMTVERLMFSGQAAPIGILLLAWQMED
jgi:hypothetical protein